MTPQKRILRDSFQQEVNSFCRATFDQAVSLCRSDSIDLGEIKASVRAGFLAILERHNQSPIADIQSGRASIVQAVCDEFPEVGPPPEHLLRLESLSVMDQEATPLSQHAEVFRSLASALPKQHSPVALEYFVRSLTDGTSRRILRGILAAMACNGTPCSMNDIITIATAVDETDVRGPESEKMAGPLAADMLYLVDLVKAQRVIIDAQEEQLARLRATMTESQADAASDVAEDVSPPCPVKVKTASSCCAQ